MHWIQKYDFIFFDFDGLLVNTEDLHFKAYQEMCLARGLFLPWDFPKYCSIAHGSSDGLRKEIYSQFPSLYAEEPDWSKLYAEKKAAYKAILDKGEVRLMPGIEDMLLLLTELAIPSCVVTNSFKDQTDSIRSKIPMLQKIPFWITREDYVSSKPSPDPYLKAKSKYAQLSDKVLGFEDTMRGWESLDAAGIEGVVVSSCLSQSFKDQFDQKKVAQFSSFEEILSS